MSPEDCDDQCHTKRIHLYMFYSLFLGSLLLLALIHFVFFLLSRRKVKYAAKEYATRKQEFVTLGISDLLPPPEKEIPTGGDTNHVNSDEENREMEQSQSNGMTPPEPLASSSSSAYNRILNGMGSGSLQKIDEESMEIPGDPAPINGYSSSSSTASTARGRTIMGGLHEPVIVTVATVSALFQQHEMDDSYEYDQRNRPHSGESISSMIDISDLVNSPGRTITVVKPDASDGGEEQNGATMNWRNGVERDRDHAQKLQMLEVRGKGVIGGFRKSHHGEPPLREESSSNDVIYPASDTGGIYDTEDNIK